MTESATLSFTDDCMHVAGEIDFASVINLETEGTKWLHNRAPVRCSINLSGVVRSNSAGTALLISWLREAGASGKTLSLEQVPQRLEALLRLGELDEVLPPFNTV